MQTNGCSYHVSFFCDRASSSDLIYISFLITSLFWWNDGVAWHCSREACKGQVLVKRCGASGSTVETHRDFGLGATGSRLLAPPGPFKAQARTDPTVEKWLVTWRGSAKRSGTKSLLRCVQTWWPTTRNVWPLWLPTRVLLPSTKSCFVKGSNTYFTH